MNSSINIYIYSFSEAVPVQSQTSSSIPLLGSGLNINDLFQKLVASGIVPTLSNSVENNQKSQIETQIKPIDFSDTNSLRECVYLLLEYFELIFKKLLYLFYF